MVVVLITFVIETLRALLSAARVRSRNGASRRFDFRTVAAERAKHNPPRSSGHTLGDPPWPPARYRRQAHLCRTMANRTGARADRDRLLKTEGLFLALALEAEAVTPTACAEAAEQGVALRHSQQGATRGSRRSSPEDGTHQKARSL